MLERLLIKLASLAFASLGVIVVNNQVLDGALCLGTEGEKVVITDGCFLHDQVDLPGSGEDLFGEVLDPNRPGQHSATVRIPRP